MYYPTSPHPTPPPSHHSAKATTPTAPKIAITVETPIDRLVAPPSNGVIGDVDGDVDGAGDPGAGEPGAEEPGAEEPGAEESGAGAGEPVGPAIYLADSGAGAGLDAGAAGGVGTAPAPDGAMAGAEPAARVTDESRQDVGMVKVAVKGSGPGHTVQTEVVTVKPWGM